MCQLSHNIGLNYVQSSAASDRFHVDIHTLNIFNLLDSLITFNRVTHIYEYKGMHSFRIKTPILNKVKQQ